MNKIFSKVFMWLCVGLAVTFGVAYAVATNDNMVYNLFGNGRYLIVWIAEIVIAIVLAVRIRKMNFMTSVILFILYSGLTGLTLSSIFILYDIMSIVWVFAITAGILLVFGLIGFVTNIDLTKLGIYLLMGLLAILIASLINMFIGNETFNLVLCIIGIVVFMGYIAYDVQIIKKNLYGIDDENKLAIYGAFELYLDFINIFLDLLRLFGDSRD